jgi:Ca2+-binding RTX toxin-like protein
MPTARSGHRRARRIALCALVVSACLYALPSRADSLNTLTIERGGSGTGTVSTSPEGIECGSECSQAFHAGTQVTLTATAAPNSSFVGWKALECSGRDPCELTMNDATTIIAKFRLEFRTLDVIRSGKGGGSVTSSPEGISCGSTCSASFEQGSSVTLTPTPSSTSSFTGWSGDGCSGTGACDVTMDQARSVTATFTKEYPTLVVETAGKGGGSVTSSPPGITCGGDCVQTYEKGTAIRLTATPNATSSFAGWRGAGCSGAFTCRVRLAGSTIVTARFAISADCTIVGTEGNDTLVGTSLDDVICGLGGKDVIWGLWGEDTLIGGGGNDVLIGGGSNDAIDGSAGFDTVSYQKISPWRTARFRVSVDLKSGSASGTVVGRDRLVRIERAVGTDHSDALLGSARADELAGRAGTDTIDGRDGDDVLFGNGGDDTLTGGSGNDVLHGGHGDDRLFGGSGVDTAYGGTGRDKTFGSE